MEKLNQSKKKKISSAINLIEELSWILDSKKNVDLKEVPSLLRGILNYNDNTLFAQNKYSSSNPNKNYLVGVLPNLFQDEELFKTTNELTDFAINILQIPISKAAKRSRYEYIGMIVCEITKLDDNNLSHLVNALSKIAGSDDDFERLKQEKKKSNFSWNETIYRLNS